MIYEETKGEAKMFKGDSVSGFSLTDEELKEKFRTWSYNVLRSPKVEKAIDMIFNLEKVEDVRDLVKLLTPFKLKVMPRKKLNALLYNIYGCGEK